MLRDRVSCLLVLVVAAYISSNIFCEAFTPRKIQRSTTASNQPLHFNLGNIFKEAFENDSNISKDDKTSGQVDYGDEYNDDTTLYNTAASRYSPSNNNYSANKNSAAPVVEDQLINTIWDVNLYLAGLPDADPSNNLYGSRINISNRDKNLALGVQVPEEPTLVCRIQLKKDGICKCLSDSSEFTSGQDGQWRLFEDNLVRFSLDVVGFQRRLSTTGTITKVFWSASDSVTTQTSSTYSIPPGQIYCDGRVQYGKPGEYIMQTTDTAASRKNKSVDSLGLVRVEQKMGVLGAASKMLPCGKFDAVMIGE